MNVHFVSGSASKILEELVQKSNDLQEVNIEKSVFIEIKEMTKKKE